MTKNLNITVEQQEQNISLCRYLSVAISLSLLEPKIWWIQEKKTFDSFDNDEKLTNSSLRSKFSQKHSLRSFKWHSHTSASIQRLYQFILSWYHLLGSNDTLIAIFDFRPKFRNIADSAPHWNSCLPCILILRPDLCFKISASRSLLPDLLLLDLQLLGIRSRISTSAKISENNHLNTFLGHSSDYVNADDALREVSSAKHVEVRSFVF